MEKQELQRRETLLFWYFVRSPFEMVTRLAVGYALAWLQLISLVS